jgi:hypothetical protein
VAYAKKTWTNRHSEHPNRRRLTQVDEDVYEVSRDEGIVAVEGDMFDEATMNDLETRIATGIAGAESAASAANTNANGRAPASHNHDAGNITSGILSVARGGIGATTAAAGLANLGGAPVSHASQATTHGLGNASNFGHVRLSDNENQSADVTYGVAATPMAVKKVYDLAGIAMETAMDALRIEPLTRTTLDISEQGIYRIENVQMNVSSGTGAPMIALVSGVLTVTLGPNAIMQQFMTTTGDFYFRTQTTGAWPRWVCIDHNGEISRRG